MLEELGKKETDVVCLPEQWLKDNRISSFEKEFTDFKIIARDYNMTIIPGAFYERRPYRFSISAPVIGPHGQIIGRQDKLHPFDYEKNLVEPGGKTKIFKTRCKFGIIICYDMVFPAVAHSLVKKGAEVLFSPSRIIRRGIFPWHVYVQARALENRVPILGVNVQNRRFGGNSLIVELVEKKGVMVPKMVAKLNGQKAVSRSFNLKKYQKSRKTRFTDVRKFS